MLKRQVFMAFITGAAAYPIVELICRGWTHWTMSLTGGLCLALIFMANVKLKKGGIITRAFLGSCIITTAELLVGLIVNKALGWDVWDYSQRAFNILGQICPLFMLYWFLLCIPVSAVIIKLSKYLNILRGESA